MESTDDTDATGDVSPSDLELAVTSIQQQAGVVGYRNLLSYTSALGIRVFPNASLHPGTWVKLGSGTYSVTYRAYLATDAGIAVAIKQPNASFTRENQVVEGGLQHAALTSIIQELRILAHTKLRDHPNLPHVLGVFFQEEHRPAGIRPCVVFDLALSDLQQYLSARAAVDIPSTELIRLAAEIASGLGALHACGLVHGDIKPDNVLLYMRKNNMTAAVADLGTCGASSQPESRINGSQWYCAPEYYDGSPFSDHANKPPRDVYNYGLVLWSMMIRCRELPFPITDKAYAIQHDKDYTATYLLERIPSEKLVLPFAQIIEKCIQPDPRTRPSIFQVSVVDDWAVGTIERELDSIADTITDELIADPDNPRVKTLSQSSLPTNLIGKLRLEYVNSLDSNQAIRSALTLAGLFSGAIGAAIERPWSVVAKLQWLLKAVELGSHAAVTSIMLDRDSLRLLEEYGDLLTRLTHPSFESPKLEMSKLIRSLQGFSIMPDEDSANILVWLGGNLDFERFEEALNARNSIQTIDMDQVNTNEWGNLHQFQRFTANRTADFEIVDSDAYDLWIVEKGSEIERSVFNNSLEQFIALANEQEVKPGSEITHHFMAAAIFHGSPDIVRYLVQEYGIKPNDTWDDMSYLCQAILFRRPAIVEYFLDHGGRITGAEGSTPSGLHLANRHEDPPFITYLCENLKKSGSLTAVLESMTTEGPLSGWTVAYTAMACRCWKNLEILLNHGADPNCVTTGDDQGMLILAAQPSSPAVPLSILKLLLEKGAKLEDEQEYFNSALQFSAGSSNTQSVYQLLLHGAVVPEAALQDAQEIIDETISSKDVVVLDEEGHNCPEAWQHMCEAASLVLELLEIAKDRQPTWREDLFIAMERCGSGSGSTVKLWIADKTPPTKFMQVKVPDTA
ncbi:kinase-like domain-containing protein [Xylariales sp. PMI_506]|nr:kinase-like domain-containing protein [Xylariales sp. PMI_506]